MAISDQQIFDWFLANPNADDATVAGAMDQFKLTPADIARATGANVADVQSRYNAATTPTGGIADLIAAPADNITSTGGFTKSATAPTSGGVSSVIEGDDIDTQIAQLPEEYASWHREGQYMVLTRKSDGAELDRRFSPEMSDVQLLKTGLSFVPGAGQVLAAVNIADALANGNLTNAAIGATGLIPGAANLNTALRVGQAVDTGNTLGALTALAGNTDVQNALNLGNATIGGLTTKDAVAAANLASAANSGNVGGVITNLGTLTDSADTRVAGQAVTLIQALESGNVNALTQAVNLANNVIGTSGSTSGGGSTTVGNFEDNEVTRLKGLGYTNAQIQDYFNTLDNLTGALDDQGAILTDTTSGGGSTIATSNVDQDTADFLASIGITNLDQLTDSGLSNQDILDLINVTDLADDTVTVTGSTGNITDTTGLDTGEVIPTGGTGDGVEELVVTGDKNKTDTTTIDTITGGDGNDLIVDDKGEIVIKDKKESCPIGTVLNPETGECDEVKETITCPPGKVLNEAGTACIDEVIIKDKPESCPVGTALNPETGECEPIAKTLECPEGYEPNEAGTECIPVVVIKDKKCDPGFVYDEDLQQCVPIAKTLECPTGFHLSADGLSCEPDVVQKTLECPEGYEPNEDGTACIPVVVIKDKKCQPGYVYDEDLQMCVPVKSDECAPGFHRDDATGLCVPDEEKPLTCPTGYHLSEDGKRCIKDVTPPPPPPPPKSCPVGYHLENGVCVKDKVVVPPVTYTPSTGSYVSGEETKPIYAEGMDEFDLFATLQQLLAEEPKKKDSKKSKEKTKMATGGHLDDLLAEQMTVDDLLKLLR